MTRVKNSVTTKARHKKVLKAAKGYFGSKHRLYKTAKEQLMHSGAYAYRDRKQRKRDFRKLWIIRINAACRENGISYSRFIDGLTKAGVEINRKMLSEIAIKDPVTFKELVKTATSGKINQQEKEAVKNETVKKTKATETKENSTLDLTKLTVAELKEKALEQNIKITSGMKKADIIEALK